MNTKVGRPKSKMPRKIFTTSLPKDIIMILKKESFETGYPINRLLETAIKKTYGKAA